MKKYKYAPEIKVGSIFDRFDMNGKRWIAEVVKRTEYYVNVEVKSPYEEGIHSTAKTLIQEGIDSQYILHFSDNARGYAKVYNISYFG